MSFRRLGVIQALKFVGANTTIVVLPRVAVEAKNLNGVWVIVIDKPKIKRITATNFASMFCPVSVLMIEG